MSNTDSDGYTVDEPQGVFVLFDYWDDLASVMKEGDATGSIWSSYLNDHANDTDAQKQKDPMFNGGPRSLFKQAIVLGYADQVTGGNLQYIADTVRAKIVQAIKDSGAASAFTDDRAITDYWLFLNPIGEFSAQLASRGPAGGYQTDIAGDILRLKFVTAGNTVRFTASLDFLGQLADPIAGVFTDGPSWSVYWDAVTRVDVLLPHRSSDGFQLANANTQNTNVSVHAENYQALQLNSIVGPPIGRGVRDAPTDLTARLGALIQKLSGLLAQNKFDEAEYLDQGGLLQMKVTQHPYRDFALTIDYVENLFPAIRGAGVEPHVKTVDLPGVPAELTLIPYPEYHGQSPVHMRYADGTRYVIIEIQIVRQFTHLTVHGHTVRLGDHTYVYYDDGTTLDLGARFDPSDPLAPIPPLVKTNPKPPGVEGLARTLYLHLDYALKSVIGRYNGISIFKGKAGQQIRVPGDNIIPTIWFTVTMGGTRNVPDPMREPQIPGIPQFTALSVGEG